MSQTRNLSDSRDELDINYPGAGEAPPRRNLNHASRSSLNTPLSGIRNDQDMERHCSQEKLDASLDNSSSGPELQPPNGPSQDDRNDSGGVRPKTEKAYLTLPASDDKMQVAGTPLGPPPPRYPDLFPQAARPATDSNTHTPIPTPTGADMEGSRYTGQTTHGTAPPHEGPKSGFFNLAMDYGIAEEPDVHRKSNSFVPYLPTTDGAGGVVVKQPKSLFVRKFQTNDNSAPHFNVWIGLSFVGLLCCGVVPGLVALIFIWQSRFEWEQGQREAGRASLTKGKVALVMTLLLGAAAWGYLIYYMDAMNTPVRNG